MADVDVQYVGIGSRQVIDGEAKFDMIEDNGTWCFRFHLWDSELRRRTPVFFPADALIDALTTMRDDVARQVAEADGLQRDHRAMVDGVVTRVLVNNGVEQAEAEGLARSIREAAVAAEEAASVARAVRSRPMRP